jgi:hypothetical protein
MDEAVLEALIDLRVEIEAIHKALEPLGYQAEAIDSLKTEISRETLRNSLLLKYPSLAPSSRQSVSD